MLLHGYTTGVFTTVRWCFHLGQLVYQQFHQPINQGKGHQIDKCHNQNLATLKKKHFIFYYV